MLFLDPHRLPTDAHSAIADQLRSEAEDVADWEPLYVWSNQRRQPGFAVVMRREDELRAFTVFPAGDTLHPTYQASEVTPPPLAHPS